MRIAPVEAIIVCHDYLLTPVTQQVSLQTRSRLGGVAGLWLVIFRELLEGDNGIAFRIP